MSYNDDLDLGSSFGPEFDDIDIGEESEEEKFRKEFAGEDEPEEEELE